MMHVIGVDVGATKIHSALINQSGKIIKEYKTNTEADKKKEFIISKIKHAIKEVWQKDVLAIGIGLPGPVDVKTGKIYPPNIQELKGINIASKLKEFGVPVSVENDSNCFILAEHEYGAGKGKKNLIGLSLGTGIGGGIIIDNELYTGNNGAAGELGHITIDKNGYLCSCGNHGCLEMYASGSAIQMRTIRHIMIKDVPTKLTQTCSATDVFYAAEQGDKLAKKIMADTGSYLGIGLASLINIFNPDIVILGGGVAKAYSYMKKNIYQTVKERAMYPASKVRIVNSKLKHPATIGAGVFAMKNITKGAKHAKKRFFGLF